MEETIIEAEFTRNRLVYMLLGLFALVIGVGLLLARDKYMTGQAYHSGQAIPYTQVYDSFFDFLISFLAEFVLFKRASLFSVFISAGVLGSSAAVFLLWQIGHCALTVTNRRVTGKGSFGKRVDLPLQQISSVSLGFFGSITIATASGHIRFWLIWNREDIRAVLAGILPTFPKGDAGECHKCNALSEFEAKGE